MASLILPVNASHSDAPTLTTRSTVQGASDVSKIQDLGNVSGEDTEDEDGKCRLGVVFLYKSCDETAKIVFVAKKYVSVAPRAGLRNLNLNWSKMRFR